MRRDDYQPSEGLEVRWSARFVELGECRASVEFEDEAEERGKMDYEGPHMPFGEENGNPLQDSCLENSMDRGAWRAAAHGVAKSWTRLSSFHFTHMPCWGVWVWLCPESHKAV